MLGTGAQDGHLDFHTATELWGFLGFFFSLLPSLSLSSFFFLLFSSAYSVLGQHPEFCNNILPASAYDTPVMQTLLTSAEAESGKTGQR